MNHPTIHISPNDILIDTPLDIHITNLPPCMDVSIRAKMEDNFRSIWESYAKFKSDAEGRIDLASESPFTGTYSVPDAHGLFWSMERMETNASKKNMPLQSLHTQITVEEQAKIIASANVVRHLVSPEVERQPVREQGIVGTFFCHPDAGALPTVIVLGGSEGGLKEGNAALLASYGYNTLALAYFGMEDLPQELVNIPVDYIEKTIAWVSRHPNVDSGRLGMMGTSKGGELALLSASMFPAIRAVVGFVPSAVIYPGLGREAFGESSWQYKGEPFTFANNDVPEEVMIENGRKMQMGEPIAFREPYHYWAKGAKEAEIAVEKIHGPVLLISGGDDQLWPSDMLSERVVSRLKAHDHPFPYEHICYHVAGHSFTVPGLPTTKSVESPFGGMKLLLGGNPRNNAQAQFESWQRVKAFFNSHLGKQRRSNSDCNWRHLRRRKNGHHITFKRKAAPFEGVIF